MEKTARTRGGRRWLERLLESFFQERSILWLLGTGVLLLFSSSLLIVTSHWHEITPAWKSLLLLGFTAATYASGRLGYFRLGLRRTGTVLLALTALLVPIGFLALHWLIGAGHGAGAGANLLVAWPLLGLNAVFAWIAAGGVFRHFLRGSQPTFLASYAILAAAGALAPASPLPEPITALILWAVLLAGSLKVTRHVFWLVEEHRKPRIFGFFPLLLLGSEMIAVFVLHLAPAIRVPWLGLGCVLAAAPVLLAADALARVFEEQTGGVMRPFPASIAVPLVLGVFLCIAGLALAASGHWEQVRDLGAMVPAAAITAGLLGVAARRTGKEALGWGAVAALALAYNFSPVFFRDAAARLVHSGALALRESQLPYAFYGLTYLPLLGALAAFGARARGGDLAVLARPARRFAAGMAGVLLVASLTHPKAPLPAGAALACFFAAQALLLQDRRLLAPAIAALAIAALGFTPFAAGVLGWRPHQALPALALAVAAGALLLAGRAIDRRAARWPARASRGRRSILDFPFTGTPLAAGSALLTGLAALAWLVLAMLEAAAPQAMLAAGLIAPLLALHALRSRLPGLAEAAIAFPIVAATALLAWRDDFNFPEVLSTAIGAAFVLWTAGKMGAPAAKGRIAATFLPAAARLGAASLSLVLAAFLPVVFALDAVAPGRQLAWSGTAHGLAAGAVALAWAFAAARQSGRRRFTWLGWVAALGWIAAVSRVRCGLPDLEWVPLAWTLAALVALSLLFLAPGRIGPGVTVPGLADSLLALFSAVNLIAFIRLSFPLTLAGLAALGGLLLLAVLERRPAPRFLAATLGSWHGLAFLLESVTGQAHSLGDLLLPPAPAALPLAAAAGFCLLASQALGRGASGLPERVLRLHGVALRVVAGIGLARSLAAPAIAPWEALLAVAAFGALAWTELRAACAQTDPLRVWTGEALVAAAIGYLVWFDVIELGRGRSLYALALGAFAFHGLSRLALRGNATRVLAAPFGWTALALPAAALAVALGRAALGHEGPWPGARSLALFIGAGFHFWRGIETGRRGLLAAACGIANAALFLLWNELHLSSPQLYLVPAGATLLGLVELCRREIPGRWHNPLRYAGALIILASPVPDLVGREWIHLLSLMALSTGVILASLAVKSRAMLYSGAAFLAADLVTMVVRGTLQHADLLWAFGLGLGALLIVLAAVCENRREALQARLRAVAARLETWA